MRTTTKAIHGDLPAPALTAVAERLAPIERVLGADHERALLEIELERAPAEGRSAEPYRLVANVTLDGKVFHAEAVKPSPESAADRVRAELESEIRKTRGKARDYLKRGGAAIKSMLRGFGG